MVVDTAIHKLGEGGMAREVRRGSEEGKGSGIEAKEDEISSVGGIGSYRRRFWTHPICICHRLRG